MSTLPGPQLKRKGIDAVSHAGRLWPVGEQMPEVAATLRTMNLGSLHTQAAIRRRVHGLFGNGLKETRPAGTRVVFYIGLKKWCAAPCTDVHPGDLRVPVLSCECAFGSVFSQHAVLLPGEDVFPLFVSLRIIFLHDYSKIHTAEHVDTSALTDSALGHTVLV